MRGDPGPARSGVMRPLASESAGAAGGPHLPGRSELLAATGRPLDIVLWCVQALLALVFVNASWAKLTGKPEMIALFTAVGVGQWFRYVTGILELTGAVLLMGPKARKVGAALLAAVMLGALAAHLFILHAPLTTPGVLLLASGFVVWGRRD